MITDEIVKHNIGANVTRLLEARGLSARGLSREINVAPITVSLIARGRHVPGSGILARIAEALDVSMDRLVAAPPEKTAVSA